MAPYQESVIEEHSKLLIEREKLREFTGTKSFDDLPDVDKMLLMHQLNAMSAYANVLYLRMHRFGGPGNAV